MLRCVNTVSCTLQPCVRDLFNCATGLRSTWEESDDIMMRGVVGGASGTGRCLWCNVRHPHFPFPGLKLTRPSHTQKSKATHHTAHTLCEDGGCAGCTTFALALLFCISPPLHSFALCIQHSRQRASCYGLLVLHVARLTILLCSPATDWCDSSAPAHQPLLLQDEYMLEL